MKIKTKLVLAFLALGLVSATIGIFSVRSLEAAMNGAGRLYAASALSLSRLSIIAKDFQGIRSALRELSLGRNDSPRAGDRARLEGFRKELDATIAEYGDRARENSGTGVNGNLVSAWEGYSALLDRASHGKRASRDGPAWLFGDEKTQSLESLKAEGVEAAIDAVARSAASEASGIVAIGRADVASTSSAIAIVASLGVLLAIGLGVATARSISRQLGEEPEIIRKLADELDSGYIASSLCETEGQVGARASLGRAASNISRVFRKTRELTNEISRTSRLIWFAAQDIEPESTGESTGKEDIIRSAKALSLQAAELRGAIAYYSFAPTEASLSEPAVRTVDIMTVAAPPDASAEITAAESAADEKADELAPCAAKKPKLPRGSHPRLFLLPRVPGASTRIPALAFKPENLRLIKAEE